MVYVANLAAEAGETHAYGLGDHVDAIRAHGIDPDVVIAAATTEIPAELTDLVMSRPLVGPTGFQHDPGLLSAAFSELAARVQT